MRGSANLACLVAAALLLGAVSAAAAPPGGTPENDPKIEGKRLYVEGSKHFEVGEYTEAIEAFERAYSLSEAPGLLFNIAQAHRLRGPAGCGDALRFYELYLQKDRAAADRAETEERIRQMRSCVEETSTTRSAPSSAKTEGAAATPPRATATLQRSFGWTGLGVGAAGVVVATIAGAMALGAKADLDKQCRGADCPDDLRSDVARYDTLRALTTIGFVVGAVGVSGGLVLLWTAPAPSKGTARVELWTLGTSAGVRGSF